MSIVKVQGNASGTGTLTIAAPNTNTDRTLTLPDSSGTVQVSGAAISGTTGTFSGTISGGSTVGVGGATPAASGAGITFPASQSASSDANTLDDYEEGTWTVTLAVNGFNNSATLSSSTATYTKIGRSVTITAALVMSTACRPANYVQITGAPFTPSANFVGVYDGSNPGSGNQGGAATVGSSGWFWTPMAGTTNSTVWNATVTYFV